MEFRITLVFLTLLGLFNANLAVQTCDDEVACSFIQQSNVDACSNTTLRVYCNKTCGLCPTVNPKPCVDEPACVFIMQGNVNACSNPSLKVYCNLTCGICSTVPPVTVAPVTGSGNVVDHCLSHPCVHGQCHSHTNSNFSCTCDLGYMGTQCDHVDPCYSQPCVHGQCTVKDSVGGYQCDCDLGFSGPNCDINLVRDCQDVRDNNIPSSTGDEIYVVDINESILGSRKLNVKCEFLHGVGWTVLMNREDGHLDFDNRGSTEYSIGFGNARQEFWMGLEYMHALTSDGRRYQLRVDMTIANGSHYYEIYNDFSVGPHNKFELNVGSSYGTAGDSLSGHNKFGFTTMDRDQDSNGANNCAEYLSGGWWFHDCANSCLTCNYVTPGSYNCKSMSWETLGYCISLKEASMKIRPM